MNGSYALIKVATELKTTKHEKDSIEEGYANLESETYKFIYSSCLDGLIPS
jgi:hypothetical protein